MATSSKRSGSSLEGSKRKRKHPVCSLKSCSTAIEEERVEVAVSPYISHLIDWGRNGDGIFHRDCWQELLRNARVRNPKRVTIKMEAEDKLVLKEASKTAEYHDSHTSVQAKALRISRLISQSKYCIAFTGAGISTSAGIGDYRGRRGKWTEQDRQEEDESEDEEGVAYEQLRPTYTHECLTKLVEMGLIKHIITQNGDGLHGLSGIPSDKQSELHGNVFEELCEDCGHKYMRPTYVLDDNCSEYYEDMNESGKSDIHKPVHALQCNQCSLSHRTGNKCNRCSGYLKDSIINFGDNLQENVISTATEQAKMSDLLLSLGTSMTVTPASDLVLMGKKPLQLVIVNRQKTDFDYLCDGTATAGVKVFGDCDDVMRFVMVTLLEEKERKCWEEGRTDRLKLYDKQRS